MAPTIGQITGKAAAALFEKKLLTNIYRAVVAEAIVASALEPNWEWCSADYASCDFRKENVRLEVKQSASLQSWNANTLKPSKCSFDIAERTGEWIGGVKWTPGEGRNADVYVFCHHPVVSTEADHRDAKQWRFFVVPEAVLPKQKTIALRVVERLAEPVRWEDLRARVDAAASAKS